jgi:hypothetical protein
MKRIFLLILLFLVFRDAYTQVVRGSILDKSDNKKIDFASVYINGSSTGTHSDQNGYFELDITKNGSLPLTISALGYYTVTLTDFLSEKLIEVYLIPKTFELEEVVVSARSTAKARKTNMKNFKDQFLGSGYNGQNCVITNEGDISFKNSGDTLKAYASKPILIVNNALGYKIIYYLDRFEYNWKSKTFLYKGNVFFSEDMASKMTRKTFFDKRRKNAYLGSRSHFFASLWANKLKLNGYTIKNLTDQALNYEDIVVERTGFKKYLSYKGILNISYLSGSQNSAIELIKSPVFFDSSGYFDGSGVTVIGQMAKQRIGDFLPYDFRLE